MAADDSKSALDVAAVFAAVAQRYRSSGPWAEWYVCAKLTRDPINRMLLKSGAGHDFGNVLDIGCGRGQLGISLLHAGMARSVVAIDCHAKHLMQARAAGTGLSHVAEHRDLAVGSVLPSATTALLVDVLYQLETSAQLDLLQNVARAARRRIVIRTLDPDLGLRSVFTLGLEHLLRRVWPHGGKFVNPLPVAALVAILADLGFVSSVVPCWDGTPFANVLLIAERPGPA